MRTGYTLALIACLGLGCSGVKPSPQNPTEPPQKADIESHIQTYEKAKKKGSPTVGIMVYLDALSITADLYENLGACWMRRDELKASKNLDLEVAAGELAQATAEKDQALRDRLIWGSVGLALGIALGVTGMALTF